jgi:hypothetical protein
MCGRLASSSLAPCRIGTMRWHAHARRVATASTLPIQLTTLTPAYGQNFHPLACPSRHPLLPRCTLSHASTCSLCRRVELSHHLPPCAGPRCLYAIRNYKRDLPRAFCPHSHRCLPPGSHRCCLTNVFHHSISAKPSHPTSLPVCRSQSFLELRSCFLNQEGDTFTAVELRRHRPRR